MGQKGVARRNICLYRWNLILFEPLMWGPVLITCLMHLGKMPLHEIYLMEGIVVLGFVFLEIPSGALADLIGRKYTILIGGVLHLVSITWFAFMDSPFDVWGANISWMLGATLRSGADSAFLYDSLVALYPGPESQGVRDRKYKEIEGGAVGTRFLLIAFSSLAVGFLAEISLRIPLFLSLPGILVSSSLPFFFKELPRKRQGGPAPSLGAREWVKLMRVSILFVANHKAVKWIVMFTVLIGVTSKLWFFTYNPYFELVGLDLSLYGALFFALNVIAWFFSKYAYNIEQKVSERGAIILMVVLTTLPIFLMGTFVALWASGLVLIQNVTRGFIRPFLDGFLNRHLDSENRATVISIRSAVRGLSESIALWVFGGVLAVLALPTSLQILGLSALVLGLLGIRQYRRIFG